MGVERLEHDQASRAPVGLGHLRPRPTAPARSAPPLGIAARRCQSSNSCSGAPATTRASSSRYTVAIMSDRSRSGIEKFLLIGLELCKPKTRWGPLHSRTPHACGKGSTTGGCGSYAQLRSGPGRQTRAMVDAGQIEAAVYWTPADVGEGFGPGRRPGSQLTDFREGFRQTLLARAPRFRLRVGVPYLPPAARRGLDPG